MRITLTIDDEVVAELERQARVCGASLEQLLNDALRRGLHEISAQPTTQEAFRTRPFDCGPLLIDRIDCIGEVLAMLDAEEFLDLDRRNRLK